MMAPDVRSERHHDGLGCDQPLCPSEIGLHRIGSDDEFGTEPDGVFHGPGDQHEGFRQQQPFGLPRSRRPFMVVDRSIEHGACETAQRRSGAEKLLADDRISLVRHGAGAAMALAARLQHFPDFGLCHQHDIGCDLAQARGDQSKQANRLGQGVARGVPCDKRLGEFEFAGQPGADAVAVVAERGKGADGAAELNLQDFLVPVRQDVTRGRSRPDSQTETLKPKVIGIAC